MENIIELIKKIKLIKPLEKQPPNFFNIGGSGYFENPTTDLMAIFMGGENAETPDWLARALVCCLIKKELCDHEFEAPGKWKCATARREVSISDEETDTLKRLDLVIETEEFILGIEHKVYASASNNPFDVYDRLLNNNANGRTILKCVLRPSNYSKDVKSDWPVISYDELITQAKILYGQEIAFSPISKWHFFFVEFLQHLHFLAHPETEKTMNSQAFDFVIDNFSALQKGKKLLADFEMTLLQGGKESVSRGLQKQGIEPHVSTRIHTWGIERALRFYPENWGKESNVTIVYSEHDNIEVETQFNIYIRAYVYSESTKKDLSIIKKELCRITQAQENEWLDEETTEENHCWYEQNNTILCFGAYAKKYPSPQGTLKAIEALTEWLQVNVFSETEN